MFVNKNLTLHSGPKAITLTKKINTSFLMHLEIKILYHCRSIFALNTPHVLRVFIEFRPSLNSNMWAGSDFAELNAKFWFKIGVPAFKTIQKIAQCEIRILLCIVCSVRISLRNSAPVYRSILLYRSRQVCEIFTQHSTSSVSIY